MNSLIRISSVVNRATPANPFASGESIQRVLSELMEHKPDIIVFPSYSLCSASSGSILQNPCIADICNEQLDEIAAFSNGMDAYIIVGTIAIIASLPVPVCAVVSGGRVLCYIPHDNSKNYMSEGTIPILSNAIFEIGGLKFTVVPTDLKTLSQDISSAAKSGCDAVIATSCSPIIAGETKKIESELRSLSKHLGIAIALSNGGIGDTSSPFMHCGISAISDCGELVCFERDFQNEIIKIADIDTDIIRCNKLYKISSNVGFKKSASSFKKGVLRKIRRNPYLPENENDCEDYLRDIFELQTQSLVSRMENTGIRKLILGVSGGLDSTLALLVAAKALKELNLPKENLIGVTMPGFGTSDRTYFNALSLIDILGAQSLDISIKEAVLQHFQDINHNISQKDITYENSQARERTQILFDLGNKYSALVVGTGDLSEEALGWCTFGGDHMAGYNVNVCITKTVIRSLVTYLAQCDMLEGTRDLLTDIVDTPVSPELLPPDENGSISQKTEDILGPYELHDFFLYYFTKYNLRPEKLFFYACVAFSPELSPSYIKEKLALFTKRFFSAQFKRSCAPDSAIISEIALGNNAFPMPSDCNAKAFLYLIDNIKCEG